MKQTRKIKQNLSNLCLMLVCSMTVFSCLQVNQNINEDCDPQFEEFIAYKKWRKQNAPIRKSWYQQLHKASPDIDWKKVETENTWDYYQETKQKSIQTRDNIVDIGEGLLKGSWTEKGSNNQAGSVLNTAYEFNQKLIYAVAAGGSLWKSNIYGNNWEIVNQQLRFDGCVLEVLAQPNSSSRIVASIQDKLYFSDGAGLEWEPCDGFDHMTQAKIGKCANYIAENAIFIIMRTSNNKVELLKSVENGMTFESVHTFQTQDLNKVSMSTSQNGANLFIIEYGFNKGTLFEWSINSQQLVQKESFNHPDLFDGKANLASAYKATGFVHYITHDNELYQGNEDGSYWLKIRNLQEIPWNVGVYISKYNPNTMFYGAIHFYISKDGGTSWTRANYDFEYYTDVEHKLHADIMDISEYEINGLSYLVVANHGGISTSRNSGTTFDNIGMSGLNISQYYDVKTHPEDSYLTFNGSQDQGYQRGYDLGEGAHNFSQILSGDYGHLSFTRPSNKLWMIGPYEFVRYFKNPNEDALSSSISLHEANSSVWLQPMVPSPYEKNEVYIGSGNLNGNSGSHIIQLQAINDIVSIKQQLPFNFGVSGGDISAIAFNQFNPNIWYVMTTNGHFFKSINGGIHFTEMENGLPLADYLYGTKIYPSKTNANVIYVCGSGYSNSPIYKSIDGGLSFQAFNTNLPPTTVFDLDANNNESLLFAATEAGPFVYIKADNKWHRLAENEAPNQAYWSVHYVEDRDMVQFGTYGRGIWNFNILEFTKVDDNILTSIQISPNPTSDFININNITRFSSVYIHSLDGNIIFEKQDISEPSLQIDISHLTTGTYFMSMQFEGNIYVKKILKI